MNLHDHETVSYKVGEGPRPSSPPPEVNFTMPAEPRAAHSSTGRWAFWRWLLVLFAVRSLVGYLWFAGLDYINPGIPIAWVVIATVLLTIETLSWIDRMTWKD